MGEKGIIYLCNRERCDECIEECKHTSSKEYALHPDLDPDASPEKFKQIGRYYWEV